MPLVAKGESLSYDRQQRKLHASHHPEVCRWRDPTVRVCMPSSMPEQLAERLAGVPLERAVEDVIAWARADVPPVGYVGSSDAFVYWRDRWDQTRATASTGPPGRAGGRRAGVAPAPAGRAIPDAAETDALLEELGWVPS
ncbi:MAG: hypothetical protein Q8L86_10155 [Vicinamibacterales bacterium]|nr:hypothetical protein [Vicinamibacterales bacterium]